MKQKIYSLFLTALMSFWGMNIVAQTLSTTFIDGVEYYIISTADDLAILANIVNSGEEMDANAVLTDDIDLSGVIDMDGWTAIGNWVSTENGNACYKGHFDGQGHTISGFNATSSHNYFGIFGVISTGALIENFSVKGTITTTVATAGVVGYARDATPTIRNIHSYLNINNTRAGARLGGILGSSVNGTIVVDRSTYSGTMDGNDSGNNGNYGGIVGYTNNNANAHLQVTNCLFDGTLKNTAETPGGCTFGGIVGYVGANPDVTITNCLSIGSLQSAITGQFYGAVKHNTCSIINSFYQGDNINGSASTVTPTTQQVTKVTDAQLASGEIAYLMNESISGGGNWFQKLMNMTFVAEQYIITVNGETRAPETANVTLVSNGDGTYNFVLPNFVLHTNAGDFPAGDVCLEGVTITEEGTFNKAGIFSVPDENIPNALISIRDKLQNVPYTLSGKVNGDKLYATITDLDINLGTPFPAYQISVEVGTDDFSPKAPTGDAYPTPNGTAFVYLNGHQHCDGTPYASTGFSNVNLGIETDDHDFVEGFCSYCGEFDPNYMAANEDGFFEISNEIQLLWFAAYVNQADATANAIVQNDLNLRDFDWMPIGKGATYSGIFEGNGFTISNLTCYGDGDCNGLFGKVKNATIRNFWVSGTLYCAGSGSGVVGWSEGSTISDIHSSLTIYAADRDGVLHHAGGVVGGSRDGTTVERCSYSGEMYVNADSHDCFGGIAGYTNTSIFKDCLFTGTITYKKQNGYVGGIVGYINNASCQGTHNCLSTGKVIYAGEGEPDYGGAIIGRLNNHTASNYGNSYWLTGSAPHANGGNQLETNFEVTAAQLQSGEVAFNLGDAWSQLFGTDNTPVLGDETPVFYVGAAGYSTMYDTADDWVLNGEATAFIATSAGDRLLLTAIDDIPAGTAVVLKGSYYNKLATTATSDVSDNELLGTDADTVADGTMYILAKPEGMEIGFYQAEGTIPAGKAYFKNTSSVKAFFFATDDPTGIENINVNRNETIYNVAGQRFQKMRKGINIIGSKKVLY